MKRIQKTNLNTPLYWEKYTGERYQKDVRTTGLLRYVEVLKYINKQSEILDTGCGCGDFLKYLLENKINFLSYNGFDFSHISINNNKKDLPTYNWLLGDCQTFDFEINKYNCVIAMQLLEHLDEPRQFLKKIFEVLKINGQIIITIPNETKIQHESHVYSFSEKDLSFLLSEAGFKNIQIKTINNNKCLFAVATKLKKIVVVTPVLCPSENVFNTIKKCFESIRKAVDKVNGKWIIVDDGSLVGRDYFKQISDEYLQNEKTTGVSYSLNRGMKEQECDFLVKLDSDYFVPENLFEILLKDWTDDLGFISPSFVLGNPQKEEEFKSFPKITGGIIDKPSGSSNTFEYNWGGGVLMFSKKAGEKIDYFDEDFGTGRGQDNDFIYRLLLQGYNWRWTNNVIVKHFQSISCNDPNAPENLNERRKKGMDYFKKKHNFPPGGFINLIYQKFKYDQK